MTEKPIRWFEQYPDVIARGKEQDDFFRALDETLAAKKPFAEFEEDEASKTEDHPEEPVAKRTWQPDPSWHQPVDTQLDRISTDDIIGATIELLDHHFYKPEQVGITEVALRYAAQVTQLKPETDQDLGSLESITEKCIQELHVAIDSAIEFGLLTDSLGPGEEIRNSAAWKEYYTQFGAFGVILTLATILNQLENVHITNDAISVVGKTTFSLDDISLLPGTKLLGKAKGTNTAKPLSIEFTATEDTSTLTCLSDLWVLRQHPDWYNLIHSGNLSGVSIQLSLMAGSQIDQADKPSSKSRQNPTFCRLSACIELNNAEAEPLVMELPSPNETSLLETVETFFSFFVLPNSKHTIRNQERMFAAQS